MSEKINMGIDEGSRKQIADGLTKLLAENYTLYLKTQKFHWNVEGPLFASLHAMFETQYNDLSVAVDDTAERIRALGFKAPGSFTRYQELSSIKEETEWPNAEGMVAQLVSDHERVVATLRELCKVAEQFDDIVTADFATQRAQVHEKTAWMLRSVIA